MRTRFIALLGGVLTIAAGAAVFYAPHYTVYRVRQSVEARDSQTLSRYVDYPALRESLKAHCTALLDEKAAKSEKDTAFRALGLALAQALVKPAIDSLVTPEGLAMLLQGRKPDLGRSRKHREKHPVSGCEEKPGTELSMGYDGPNRFSVLVRRNGSASEPITLIFGRYGITSWKLCGVDLPS